MLLSASWVILERKHVKHFKLFPPRVGVIEGWSVAQIGFEEGRCKATWKGGFKVPWREAGPLNHPVDSDQWVVNKELSLRRSAHHDDKVELGQKVVNTELSQPADGRCLGC